MQRRFIVSCLSLGPAVLAGAPASARAANVGQAYDALPGLHRVPVAEPSSARVAAALSMGYGVTEARAGESAGHQRLSTIAAIGVAPLPRLQFALSAAARYDHHPNDDEGSDSGTVLDPRVSARWVEPLSASFALGFELGAWFPGTESAARTLRATTPHAAVLGTLSWGPLTFGVRGGYQLDRSAKAAPPDAERLRAGDRLALGLSDFDAALLGVGAVYRIGDLQLFAEASAELLLGGEAPPLRQSPIGASAGARYAMSERWSLELLGESSFSARPALGSSEPLVPVQPRYAAFAGVRFRWPASESESPRAAEPPRLATPTPELVDVRVDVHFSVPDDSVAARATLQQNGAEQSGVAVGAGQFEFRGVKPGKVTLSVVAEGYEPSLQEVELTRGSPLRVSVELRAIAPQAQLRGLVRSFGGRALAAHVTVEPLGRQAVTDAAGFFELDVPAGRYEVRIEAAGYRPQRKSVVVEKDGVVILNADLTKEP
jgi:Carboxypeptidase regulatory-like domain